MLGKVGLCMPLSYIFTKVCTSHLLTSILVVFSDVLSVYMIQNVLSVVQIDWWNELQKGKE
jgi:hypothetical protein